jgi:hypothetical protein
MWFLLFLSLLVFLSLAPNSMYSKNCLLFLHQLHHWKEQALPISTILKHSIYSFNEEMGELCFAMLGRTVLGDNHQCNRPFRPNPTYRQLLLALSSMLDWNLPSLAMYQTPLTLLSLLS